MNKGNSPADSPDKDYQIIRAHSTNDPATSHSLSSPNKKPIKMNYNTSIFKTIFCFAMYVFMLGFSAKGTAQVDTTVTVRFANPIYYCDTMRYCVDVQFKSNVVGIGVNGVNVRFFYPDSSMEITNNTGFRNFAPNYRLAPPVSPLVYNPQTGPGYFLGLGTSQVDFENAAVELIDGNPPVILNTVTWTTLFQVCFDIDPSVPEQDLFCPSIIWDLRENPANGGYLVGDDGVVITIQNPINPMTSQAVTENVVQFNWAYDTIPPLPPPLGPFGFPVDEVCISIDCSAAIICAADTTIQCTQSTAPAVTGFATATDNCPGNPVISFSDVTTPGNCPHNFDIRRQWIATNTCGGSDTCYQLIHVVDTTGPAIMCPPNLTVQCVFMVPPPNPGSVTASDNCGGPSMVTFVGDQISSQTCVNRFTVTRTYMAVDICGNFSTCQQTIRVQDDTPPVISCPSDLTVQCQTDVPAPNTGLVTSSDNCGPLNVIFLPDVISNLTCANRYTVSRVYRATDACGNAASCTQTITVFDNIAPTITCPQPLSVSCANMVPSPNPGSITASDNCDGSVSVTFSQDIMSGQTCANNFTITRIYLATDVCGNTATCTQTITVADVIPPTITCPRDVTVQCAELVPAVDIASVVSSDNCGGPATITFDGDIVSNQTCLNRFLLTRTYRATDACGNTAVCSQLITVFDNTPPIIACPLSITVQCESQIPLPNPNLVGVTDNCNGPVTRLFLGDVVSNTTCVNRYDVQRTYQISDACGNSASCSQMITVFDNTAPFIMCPGDITVQCASLVPLPNTSLVIASDNCNGSPTVTFVADAITPMGCVNRFNVARTYLATDECGNTALCTQTITVFDNTAPFIMCPGDITVQCASLVPLPNSGLVTVSDNCNGVATVRFVADDIANQTCTNRYTIARTYSAIDECGNTALCTQTITVFDNTIPFIMCPGDITVQCTDLVPLPDISLVTASDNCNGLATVSFVNDLISNQTCTNRYNIARTYRAIDECGNSASCTQTITIFDTTVPFIMCPGDITVQCANLVPIPNIALVATSDNCNGVATVSFVNDVISNQICTNQYNITRTYRAIDECGNSASCTQSITVFDNTAPFIMCPGDITVQCANLVPLPNIGLVTVSDNCNGVATVSFLNDVVSNLICVNRYNLARTYRAIDECGNSASCTQMITVFDNIPPVMTCPPDVTFQCSGQVPQPNPGGIIATDNCSGVATVSFVADVVTGQTCINKYNLARTYRAVDECGNSSSCTQHIKVFDTTAPFIMCPGNITVQCASLVPLPDISLVTASDNCNGVATVSFVDDAISGLTCTNRYNIARTYRAIDECGNSAACTQTITVFDNTAPFIMCPGNITVQCANLVPIPDIALVTASDNCNGVATVSFVNDVISNQICTNQYNIARTYRAIDDCGNSASCTQMITVFDNTVPFIMCPRDITVQCANLVPMPNIGLVTVSDNCNGVATVSFVTDAITNQTCTNRYNIARTYRAIDECGNSASCTQSITVFDNTVPFIMCPADITVQCSSLVPMPDIASVTTSDNCNGVATISFLNDVISGLTCTNRYNIARTYRAIDECGNSASCTQTITVFDNTVPFIMCPGDITVQCANQVPLPNIGLVSSSDNCNGVATVSFLNDVISGLTCTNRYNIARTYRAIDECGNSASCTQSITVFDNIPPVITCPPDVTVQCASLVPQPNPGGIVATDNCNGLATVSFVNDAINSQTCINRYRIVRTYRAVDECGNSSICTQNIRVFDNTVPFIMCPGDITVQCANLVPQPNIASVVASDNCNGAPTVSFLNDAISNQTCTNRYNISRSYLAVDACGNTAACTQIITVFDNTVPFIMCPGDITVQCASLVPQPNIELVTVSDNCNGVATVTFVADAITPLGCINRFNVARTYRATDECGNSATCTQMISVIDNTVPFIMCPGDITVQCASLVPQPNIGLVTVSDNCNGLATVTFVADAITPLGCVNRFTVARTYRATDECGNSATCTQMISVFDNTVPFIMCPGDITVQCASLVPQPNIGLVTVSDNCNGVATVTFVADAITPQGCVNRFTVARTYRATDECGNSASCTQTITVFDNTVPFIMCPGNITVQCASLVPQPNTGLVTVSDNCNGVATVTFVADAITPQGCVNRFTVARTYRATDECGNSATCTQTITVFDNMVPTIMCPANVTVQCANMVPQPNIASVTTSDNCGGAATVTALPDVITNMTCVNRFNIARTYRAVDECGNSATCTQIIMVFDATPPAITCPVNMTVQCAGLVPQADIASVVTSDNCGGAATVTVLPDVITNMVCTNRFNVIRTYRATDECGNSASCTQTITVFDNTVPFIMCPGNITVQCASQVPQPNIAGVISSDNCSGMSTVSFLNDVISAQTCSNRFNITRTYRATDECGNSASCTQTITVFDNIPPSISCPSNVTLSCTASTLPGGANGVATGTDNCGGGGALPEVWINEFHYDNTGNDVGEFVELAGPAGTDLSAYTIVRYNGNGGAVYTTPAGQTVTGIIPNQSNGFGTLSFSYVQDGLQNGAPDGFALVKNATTLIQFLSYEGTFVGVGGAANGILSTDVGVSENGTDPIGNSLRLTGSGNKYSDFTWATPAAQSPGAINAGQTITPFVGGSGPAITSTDVLVPGACPQSYTISRTWRATDDCGNSASCVQTLQVIDNIPPTIMCPVNVTVQCASLVPASNIASVAATDNCGTTTVTFVSDVISNSVCTNRFNVTRTYRATDQCGNSATCAQTIVVFDNTVPTIMCPGNVTVQCANQVPQPNPALVSASDNCNGVPTVTFLNDVLTNQTCANRYIITRTYRATDACNNSAVCTQTITVFDNTAPSFNCPGNVTVQCASLVPAPNIQGLTASDNCGTIIPVVFVNDVTVNQTCVNRFNVLRTYRATDECGNSSSCVQTISVFDNTAPFIMCPVNVTVQCASLVPVSNTGSVVTSDNCNGAVIVAFAGDVASNQTCVNRFNITRTYSATDACGNSATCSQTITVFDNTPPSIMCPANVTVQCASQVPSVNIAGVVTTDNCGGAATVTFVSDVNSNQTCVNRFLLTRTYRATDACGNSATCAQTITVFDNTAPTIMCPTNVTVQCANQVPAVNIASVTSSDNCGGAATITFVNDIITNQTCADRFNIVRTYRATDACGNSGTCSQTIVVFDSTPPTIMCPANITVQCASQVPTVNISGVVAADNCGGGATVSIGSDVITNQTCVNRFVLFRTYRATDACGNSATCSQLITVFDNTPPVITVVDPLLAGIANGGTLNIQCMGQDPSFQLPMFTTASVTAVDNCTGNVILSFNQTLLSEGNCAVDGYILLYRLTWTATDACGNSASFHINMALVDHVPPVLHNIPPAITVNCDAIPPVPTDIYATDECLCACIIVFSETSPAPGCQDGQVVVRSWAATDDCGNKTINTQNITLVDHKAPELFITQPELSNAHDGDIINYTCTEGGIPAFYDHLSAESIYSPSSCGSPGIITYDVQKKVTNNCKHFGYLEQRIVHWKGVDLCGNVSNLTITARLIDNEPPVLLNVPDTTCVDDPSLKNVDATDNCGHPFIRFWDVKIPNPCGAGFAYRRTYEAYDNCGNSVRDTTILIPNDHTFPNLSFVNPILKNLQFGEVLMIDCGRNGQNGNYTSFGPQDVKAADGCSINVKVTFTEKVRSSGKCTDGLVAVVDLIWTATDVCGNINAALVTAHVIDTTPPVLLNFKPELTIGCNGKLPEILASDNCSSVTVTTSETKIPGSCEFKYDVKRIVTATDACGNVTTGTQLIHVGDNSGPIIKGVEEEICNDLSIPDVTAFDPCTGKSVDVTMTQDTMDLPPCRDGFVVERVWTAVDVCGDSTVIHQRIIVGDKTPPVIEIPTWSIIWKYLDSGDTALVYLSQTDLIKLLNGLDDGSVYVHDDCDEQIIPVFTLEVTYAENCAEDGYFENRVYTWTATDACGNSSAISFSVNIMDDVAPVISGVPKDATIICAPLPPVPTVYADDPAGPVNIVYQQLIEPGAGPGAFNVTRRWTAKDACGNVTVAEQHILWIPDTQLNCEILLPALVQCNSHGVVISSDVTGGLGALTYLWEVIGEACFIQAGQGTPAIDIYVGWSEVTILLTVTDVYGCTTMCSATLDCVLPGSSPLSGVFPDLNAEAPYEPGVVIAPPSIDQPNNYLQHLNLWPNPANNSVNLSFESSVKQEVTFTLMNYLGQVVVTNKINAMKGYNSQKVNVADIPEGSYLMEVKSDRAMFTKVIVVLHNE